jgi:CheY-like chemotaxis protein
MVPISRSLIVVFLLFMSCMRASAQAADPFDYRQYLTPPKTTAEFWEAMKFEMEVGRFDLAAQHLHDMLAKKPTADDLVKLHEKEGIAAFLRLRVMPKWYSDRDKDKQARDDVESLIEQVTQAVRTKLTDPRRITFFISNLYEPAEEAAFARVELLKSGIAAIPYMLEELRRREETKRGPILDAMVLFGPDSVRPLLAALDIEDNVLRGNILDVIRRRRDLFLLRDKGIDVAPSLWPLVSTLNKNETIRRKARDILAVVYDARTPDYLPQPIVALTEEAEKYYYHNVRFGDPRKVALWRWDGKRLFEDSSFTPSKAEEFLGMRYAKQALSIDSTYRPAQLVMLNLLIDKRYEPPTPDRPLGKLPPTMEDLLLTLNPDVLNSALELALRDERTPTILALIKALGKLADVRTLKPETTGEPPLVRALHYGDRRVQMAAADAILRIPGSASVQASARIIDVLKTALVPDLAAAGDRPRIMTASSNDNYLRKLRQTVEQNGAEVVIANTGRQAVRRLVSKADIDAVLLDSTIVDPDLTWVIAQLRSDRGLKRLPVLIAAIPDGPEAKGIIDELSDLNLRAKTLDDSIRDRLESKDKLERVSGYAAARQGEDLVLKDQRKRRADIDRRIAFLSERYDQEAAKRVDRLRKSLDKQKHVIVVGSTTLTDPRLLAINLDEKVRETGMAPLSKSERKEHLEMALGWLTKMAIGELKGYDVRSTEEVIVNLLTAPGLSDASTLNVIRIIGQFPGGNAQRQLTTVFLDVKRPVPIRVAAADELLRHMQEYGKPGAEAERILRDTVETALKQPGLAGPDGAALRDRMTRMVGVLRPGQKTTGQRLRDFGK